MTPKSLPGSDFERFDDAGAAYQHVARLYQDSAAAIRTGFAGLVAGQRIGPGPGGAIDAPYPYLAAEISRRDLHVDARLSHGVLIDPGLFGATLTQPVLFERYYREQIALLIEHHRVPVYVGRSNRQIPLPFVQEDSVADISEAELAALQDHFVLPDLRATNDGIVNGTLPRDCPPGGNPSPLALFTAERVDYGLSRLHHYTGTAPAEFQSFVLLTNYQRYVDEFIAYARQAVADGGYTGFATADNIPQMPAYHLQRADGNGITLINIGVGPSNAKTITDHVAVLRPHCWLMLGHCAGLRRSQRLGDYVLAHGYMRADHVLDDDLPVWVPVPAIAEVQVALQEATMLVTGLHGQEMKTRLRTGTVATTDNRNWELRVDDFMHQLNLSRAIAVDMESATVAANGFRFRVPYGTLLCVSDKPLHGELKLRGMANAFYRERISQHLRIGIETMRLLREQGVDRLHSRKLRGFDEPAFR